MVNKPPRPPKLRVSCDPCGAAKVKCDQTHPSCSRCVSHYLECVYGVSKRSTRTPRQPRASSSARGGSANHDHDAEATMARDRQRRSSSAPIGLINPAIDTSMVRYDGLEAVQFPTLPPQDYYGFDVPMWDEENNMLASIGEGIPMSTAPMMQEPQVASWINLTEHDCAGLASAIWASLSPPDNRCAVSGAYPGTVTSRVSIDIILRTNRDACEQLERLLCHECAVSPDLSMLYSSIIWRILFWYQQAASSGRSVPTWGEKGLESNPPFWISSSTCATTEPTGQALARIGSTNSIATATTEGNNSMQICTPDLSQPIAGGPMMFGSFHIDDENLQAVLNVHLVSSELKRANKLIEALASYGYGSTRTTQERPYRVPDDLRSCLSACLREEYKRCVAFVESNLSALNGHYTRDAQQHSG